MVRFLIVCMLHVACVCAEVHLWHQKQNMPVPELIFLIGILWLGSGLLVVSHVVAFVRWWSQPPQDVHALVQADEASRRKEMVQFLAPRKEEPSP